MAWRRLDTWLWNLGGVALIAGCAPLITVADEDEDDGDPDRDVPPAPITCKDFRDCPTGYDCAGDFCVPIHPDPEEDDDYYYDYDDDGYWGCEYGYDANGDCCYDYGDCCYDEDDCIEDPVSCESADDCEPGEGCIETQCEPIAAIADCDPGPGLIPIPVGAAGPDVTSLTFVDANGDANLDLAVGRSSAVDLLVGPGTAEPVRVLDTGGAPAVGVVAGRFAGDETRDLAVADEQRITVLTGATDGTFAATDTIEGLQARQLATVQFDSTDSDDVALVATDGRALVLLGEGLQAASFDFYKVGSFSLATADADGDGLSDVAIDAGARATVYAGNSFGSIDSLFHVGRDEGGPFALHAGLFHGTTPTFVRHRDVNSTWVLIESADATGSHPPQALLAPMTTSAAGDLDGDALVDLIVADDLQLTVAYGGFSGEFGCARSYDLPLSATLLAVGDLDGDGRPEIAVSDGAELVVLANAP